MELAVRNFPAVFCAKLKVNEIIADLQQKNYTGLLHPALYNSYNDNLRAGVNGVLNSPNYGDKYFDTQLQLNANVSRFAAYKAYHATAQIREQLKMKDGVNRAKAAINTFNRYQAAEYNTCVARCRTAKQWLDFTSDAEKNKLFPNLKWIASRSADPREEHMVFYGLILPKTDPFWLENFPGNIWNCKCDWEETDEPAAPSAPDYVTPAKGLEGNPANTGEVFTDKSTYFQGISEKQKAKINAAYSDIVKVKLLEKLQKFIGTQTAVGDLSVGYSELGNQQLIADLQSKKIAFLKNEVLLHAPDFLLNCKKVKKVGEKYYFALKLQQGDALSLTATEVAEKVILSGAVN